MNEPANPEVEILNTALELCEPERSAYLGKACAGDVALRQRVKALLNAHEQAGGFLSAPPARVDFKRTMLMNVLPTEKPGDKIGHYKLLQQIGEGGCGVVYMAEQEEPVRRRVALKVIKLGMDTKEVIARFEAERQALALMDHPNIAKVLDAGATRTGRPYFVMELVRGIKITDYCDENKISTEERLKLFIQVCQAIQHAHQKGIIHRDIKPSNILVTVNDGVPVPKVIDFGIAKATQGRLTDKTLFTAFEQFIGTPAYMSPEQAVMTSLDIDTRSDIYSLGVLLYELLTGKTPFDSNELFQAGFDAMRHIIREKEPPKPSTRLSTMLDAERTVTATHRHTDPPKLIHLVRGDLDWIVMKSLEKDRARRYETANGFAADIQRHLTNEPVVARPPSTGYRTLKFVRRNKVVAVMSTAVTLALLVGLVAALAGFAQARRERDHAQAARNEAVEQKLRADQGAAENHRRLVLQYLANGNRSVDAGNVFGALPWFGRALEVDQADPVQAEMHRLRIDTIIQQSPKLVAFCALGKVVKSAEFSCDSSRFTTASGDGTARVWNANTGEPITPPLKHAGVVSARFSPDGRWVATASSDGTAQVWNAATGEPRTPPLRHKKGLRSVTFSPDGRWVLTASEDYTAQVWDAATGQPSGPPLQDTAILSNAEFSPDGSRIFTVTSRGGIHLWILSPEGLATSSFNFGGDAPAFSPDGKRLATIVTKNLLTVFDVMTGKQVFTAKGGGGLRRAVFSPDGKRIVTLGENSQVWDADTGAPITAVLQASVVALDGGFSPDGRTVMTAGADYAVRFWDPLTGLKVATPLTHSDRVRTASFSPDGRRVLTGCDNGTVRVWDLAGTELASLPVRHSDLVHRIAFHPDSRRVLTVDVAGGAVFWDLETGRKIESVLTNLAGVSSAEFSADGQRVAVAYIRGEAQVFDLISGAPTTPPLVHQGPVNYATFSPDGSRLATASQDGSARIWDLRSGSLISRMEHSQPVSYVTFTPDGKSVVTVILNSREGLVRGSTMTHSPANGSTPGTNATVQRWDAATGKSLGVPINIEQPVSWVSFSPDRRFFVTSSSDTSSFGDGRSPWTFVWEIEHGSKVTPALSHSDALVDSSFSSDGKSVLTSAGGGSVRIWDATTGKRTLTLNSGPATWSAFSPDNHLIVTAANARLWDAVTGEPVSAPFKINGDAPLNLAQFSPDGRYLVLATGDNVVQSWKISRSNRPVKDELQFAQMIAGSRVDEQEAITPVSPTESKTAWQELRAKYPGDLTVTPEQALGWRGKVVGKNIASVQEHIQEGRVAEAKNLIRKMREAGDAPEAVALLEDLVNLREIMDEATKAGDTQTMLVEIFLTPLEKLGLGYPAPPVTSAAEFLYLKDKSAAAEKIFEDLIAFETVTSGDSDFNYGYVCKSYGEFLLYRENKPSAALGQLLKALSILRALPDRANQHFWTLREIGDALVALDRAKEGEPYHQEALTISRTSHSDKKNQNQSTALSSLGFNLLSQKHFHEAELSFREARDFDHKSGATIDAGMAWTLDGLARSLTAQKQFPEAELIYREELSAKEKLKGAGSDDYGWTLANLNEVLKAQGKPALSTDMQREAH